MLPKHWARRVKTQESLQRTLCRAGVLLCAVIPVLWLMAATCYWRVPWVANSYANQVAATISDSCGVSATIGELKYLAPNRVEIKNLKVANPETFEIILEVPSLIAERHASQWEVRMSSPQCALDQVLKLARMAHDRFLCRADDRLAPVRIFADATNVTEAKRTLWTGTADVLFDPSSQASSLKIRFQPNNESQKIGINFVRSREQPVHVTTTQLETNGHEIPIDLMQSLMPITRSLGTTATFSGSAVWVSGIDERMSIEKSLIKNCQWESITSSMNCRMTGVGGIYIEGATIINGQILEAGGIVLAENGVIDKRWLVAAKSTLKLRMPDDLGKSDSRQFSCIRLYFRMNSAGVVELIGGLKPLQDGLANVVLCDTDGPLVYEASQPLLDTNQLVRWINATSETSQTNPVTPASYETTSDAAQTNSVGAYLMTVLPSPNVKR